MPIGKTGRVNDPGRDNRFAFIADRLSLIAAGGLGVG